MIRRFRQWRDGAPVVFLHEFKEPPYGGGSQFLLALRHEFERRGIVVGHRVGRATRAVLFNSHHGDPALLRDARRRGVRIVHRVDGPIARYRGRDDGTDGRIHALNAELADATVFQSRYSLAAHDALGLAFREPVVITNAADPAIFYPGEARIPSGPLRVIATAWSDNNRKGGPAYAWLDAHLDPARVQFTFVGRVQQPLPRSVVKAALPSLALADELRRHDVYLTASEDDPCSNALIEALSCGLPAVYRRSGGHPELVGRAGLGFDDVSEVPALLDRVGQDLTGFRGALQPPSLASVSAAYLRVLGLH